MKNPRLSRWLSAVLALALLLASPLAAAAAPGQPVVLQFVNVSDWHAQLDPLVVGTTQVGGAAALSAYFEMERTANPNTLVLTAGDAYGASPPLSAFFNEVPAVQAMNLMGFDADTFGNHNFDKGVNHLQQMIDLADFPYVVANLTNLEGNLTGVKPFEIFEVGGVKVAVIGLINPEAPTLVFPGSFNTLVITDPVRAANKARAEAKKAGADIVVLITHMGVTNVDANGVASGPLIDLANAVGGFDLILGDHTDFEFGGIVNNMLVVENRSKGLTYARTQLTVDSKNGRVLHRSVAFVTPLVSAVTPDPAVAALVEQYRAQLAPILSTQIGSSTVAVPRADSCGRADGRLCESLVGNITTDAMRLTYGTDFAITNSGGLRANLTCPTTDSPSDFCPPFVPPPYPITRGQVLGVLPFGNVVVTLSVNGAELKALLENGVSSMPGANGRFPQVSGLCFTYDISAAAGNRVTGAVRQAADGSCTGAAVDLTTAATYTLAENDFMATGGDGYLNLFSRAVTRDIMDQVLADYVAGNSPLSPTLQGRIVCTTSGATACPVALP